MKIELKDLRKVLRIPESFEHNPRTGHLDYLEDLEEHLAGLEPDFPRGELIMGEIKYGSKREGDKITFHFRDKKVSILTVLTPYDSAIRILEKTGYREFDPYKQITL